MASIKKAFFKLASDIKITIGNPIYPSAVSPIPQRLKLLNRGLLIGLILNRGLLIGLIQGNAFIPSFQAGWLVRCCLFIAGPDGSATP